MEAFGKLCFNLLLLAVTTIFSGFIMMKMYGLLVIPIFHTPLYTLTQFIAISTFWTFLGLRFKRKKNEPGRTPEEQFTEFLEWVILMLFFWLMAYIIYGFL